MADLALLRLTQSLHPACPDEANVVAGGLGIEPATEVAFTSVTAAQIAVAEDWGTLDGRCTERIFAEIDRLVAARSSKRRPDTAGAAGTERQ